MRPAWFDEGRVLDPGHRVVTQLPIAQDLFTEGALRAVSRQALARKAGARGLRSILETSMLDLMYDLPSREDIEECVINEEVIEQGSKPLLVLKREAESA